VLPPNMNSPNIKNVPASAVISKQGSYSAVPIDSTPKSPDSQRQAINPDVLRKVSKPNPVVQQPSQSNFNNPSYEYGKFPPREALLGTPVQANTPHVNNPPSRIPPALPPDSDESSGEDLDTMRGLLDDSIKPKAATITLDDQKANILLQSLSQLHVSKQQPEEIYSEELQMSIPVAPSFEDTDTPVPAFPQFQYQRQH